MESRGERLPALPAEMPLLDLAETLVAMANSRGGTLLLELGKRQTIDEAIDKIREASLMAEPTLILPMPVAVSRYTVAVSIPSGLSHVFSLEGRFWAREGERNRPLSPRELRRLMIERGEISFEDNVPSEASLADLDHRSVEAYAARLMGPAYSVETVLAQRGCIVHRDGEWVPTYAGLLLFGNDPQRYVRGAFITAARFAGLEMSDTFTRQEITGNIPEQILAAETFLLDNMRRGVQLGAKMERSEQLEYPMEAARELVVNAVAHRDYSIQGDGIRLFLFANRLEVTSPGGLPGPVTVENIIEERFSRNSILVQVLADIGFIERLGYGVDRVIVLMQERHLPAPEFFETSGGFRVRLFNVGASAISAPAPLAVNYTLNPRQERALHYLTQGGYSRITNKDLQELYPDVHSETIRRDLADLVSKGFLIKKGQKRGSYYVLQQDI